MRPHQSVSILYLLPRWLNARVLPISVGKELRALMPAWLITVLIGCAALGESDSGIVVGLMACWLGCTALGAMSTGQEFAHRTIGMLLAQPSARSRLWRAKMLVLAGALLTAAAPLIAAAFGFEGHWRRNGGPNRAVLAIPVLSGFLVAPWLALVCRGSLAGAVFAAAFPVPLVLIGSLLSPAILGPERANSRMGEELAVSISVMLLLACWILGGIMGYRKWMRLEVIEGHGPELQLPAWLFRSRDLKAAENARRRKNNLVELVRKELRLQQVTFLVAGLFVVAWLLQVLVKIARPDTNIEYIGLAAGIYAALVALLAGALSCGEERQYGTAELHLTLPTPAWKQWLVKVGVVLGTSVLLALVLPAALLAFLPLPDPGLGAVSMKAADWILLIMGILLVSCSAIYASSMSANTVRAVLVAMPVCYILMFIFMFILAGIGSRYAFAFTRRSLLANIYTNGPGLELAPQAMSFMLCAGFLLLVLRLAFVNYRLVDHPVRRVLGHLGWICAATAGVFLCYTCYLLFYYVYLEP